MERKLVNTLGLLTISSSVLYAYFFSLERNNFIILLILYAMLMASLLGYAIVARLATQNRLRLFPEYFGFYFYNSPLIGAMFVIGLVLRLVLLNTTPNLSQDFYRFLWDGQQLIHAYNPYLYIPDDIITTRSNHIPNATWLYDGMGSLSSSHYTNYPPFNQLFFALTAWFGGDNLWSQLIWMRVIIIIADIGVFVYSIKLLKWLNKPLWLVILYYLNPFTIVELTGNLHWEGVMALFLLMAIYYLIKNKNWYSALFMAASILTKLLPLIALPLVVKRIRVIKAIKYYIIVGVLVLFGFVPFMSLVFYDNYMSSVGLWFGNFEFNASIYYLIRAIGYQSVGYNIIGTVGKVLPVITLIIILIIALLRPNQQPTVLLSSVVLVFFTYLTFATTVHPWYITIPLLFTIFTSYRFMWVWSVTIFLSYAAYNQPDYLENHWVLLLEYLPVFTVFACDLHKQHNTTDNKAITINN